MKEIKNKVPKTKLVVVPTDETFVETLYETQDGQIFNNKKQAERHERDLTYLSIKKATCKIFDDEYIWYKAKTEEELEFLKSYLHSSYNAVSNLEQLKINQWFTVINNSYEDVRGCDIFITYTAFKNQILRLEEVLEVFTYE